MNNEALNKIVLPENISDILKKDNANIIIPNSREELMSLAMGGDQNDIFDVSYDIEGIGNIREAYVTKCKNGIVVNYDDIYMRRRDPNSMIIADDFPTDKKRHKDVFGKTFEQTRNETIEWLKNQESLIIIPFLSGYGNSELGYPSILIAPSNAGFFAAALADLQGFIPKDELPNFFRPRAIIFVAPPFRHTHYDGKQVVVHNRLYDIHEVFSYNLYPGPSAKKGIYAVLIDIGERERWTTLHASTVKIITPYDLTTTIMHEGASGGGKSEMIEHFHRESDGKLKLGTNIITGEDTFINIADSSEIHPVTDDMAMCHPGLQKNNQKLVVIDAEDGWFLRVNHINKYGTEPLTEKNTIHPKKPLIFFNMNAVAGSTCLLWEHIMDDENTPCPNPRVIMPRNFVKNVINNKIEVDIRSFGIRTPPTTKDNPNYGIIGMFHILTPALAWLWRLVAPRGFANPSIIDSIGMKSEGVGSYWPFATGKKVDQANLLLDQILKTPMTKYILIPNQHIGAYYVGFSAQWITREYLSKRGGANFRIDLLEQSRCSLLGYTLKSMKIDGSVIGKGFLQVNHQPEVGNQGYDEGAKILKEFFKEELKKYLDSTLMPLGKKIIEACLDDAIVSEYEKLI